MKTLVIVESPAKAKTIGSFLDSKKYKVIASLGHIRNLPKSTLGIDVEKDFEPKYIVPKDKIKFVNGLKKEIKDYNKIILASDEDREGEAIAWHLKEALKIEDDQYQRIVFHEITPEAINEALNNPRKIDMDMVLSQQARRILDRLVGYKLSPFLWKKILKGLSAGRVQTPALRLIVEKEREIEKFKSEEYWTIDAQFKKTKCSFIGNLFKIDDEVLDKFYFKHEKDITSLKAKLENKESMVEEIKKNNATKNPYPPFTTSTMQQGAYQVCHFSAKKTMLVAQKLYEGININGQHIGLITYMRTDSLHLSNGAIMNARDFIQKNFGEKYLPNKLNIYKTKSKLAQEAHEAIRVTDVNRTPEKIKEFLSNDEYKLYDLIWRRFVACQMAEATLEKVSIITSCKNDHKYYFKTDLQIIKFEGFLKVTPVVTADQSVDVNEQDIVTVKEIITKQHFTEPPARFNDASLIKTLEKYGIGRPSTYALIVSILIERGYVNYNDSHAFVPTDIGIKTNDMLVDNFQEIADFELTKKIEDQLDEIAGKKANWSEVLKNFYGPFDKNLQEKYEKITKLDLINNETTNELCPECGTTLVIKMSRFGKFMACPNFPKCRFTKSINELNIPCPKCKTGNIVRKRTKRGKSVYGCDQYPKCDFIINQKPLKDKCPDCGYPLINKNKKVKKCSNKDCHYDTVTSTNL